ncbi:MAG: F0F1 ATP synthase subunit gamma [Bacteroidetes bacterium]|nr:F0F1 ATP synthase subunit gamma [Bacteroidota bacterium]
MANLKEVRTRISSTLSTQQITKAMKLVSATKLRKAQNTILQMRPYSEKLSAILSNLASSADDDNLKVFFKPRTVKNVLILVITSDRGLCGPFNTNIVKAVKSLIDTTYSDINPSNITLMFMGKKGFEALKTTKFNFDTENREVFQNLSAEKVFEIQGMMVGRNLIIMTIFGVAMIAASVSMIKGSATDESLQNEAVPYLKLVVTAVILGLFTGIVGAGGGFMIVPALVLILKIPVKDAIGTSLLIIAVNTLIGFTGNIGKVEIDWAFLIPFALVMIAGTVPGIYLNKKIPAKKIKPVFGWFLLAMGVYTLVKEIFLTK